MVLGVQNSAETYLETIEDLDSLKPCAHTNNILSALVSDIVEGNVSGEELRTSEIQRLRQLCGKAEFELEKKWAERIAESEEPEQKIREFPYYRNYIRLADLEYSTLLECCNRLEKSAVFVGGGALPMTAIIFAKHYGFEIDVIERDRTAVERSRKLLESLGIDIDVLETSAQTFNDYEEYHTVHVASMVGQSRDEELEVFQKIRSSLRSHTHIMARTVHGNRKLLYRPVSDNVRRMFSIEAERRPSSEIVNSAMVLSMY